MTLLTVNRKPPLPDKSHASEKQGTETRLLELQVI